MEWSLGILLSNNLKWTAHIDELLNKTSKRLNLMRALMHKIDRRSLESIYMSFIIPCLEYGDVLLTNANENDLAKLDSIQTEAMRITVGATARCNINLLYEECKWPCLTDRRMHHCLTMMYKTVNGLVPLYLQELLPTNVGDNARYPLRNNEEIRVPFARLEIFRKSFIPSIIVAWNELDITTKSCLTLESFKRALQPEKEPKREILYYGSRWASIHHSRIRIGCSKLGHHLCNNLHVIPSPRCQCGHDCEDPSHFFFDCPLFDEHRVPMLNKILLITEGPIDIDLLLNGDNTLDYNENKRIFDSVHQFLKATKQFSN